MSILSFDQALDKAKDTKTKHLMLGNGFSMALMPNIFSYGSLLDKAESQLSPFLRSSFDALDTTDFEVVMNALKQASSLVALYDKTNPTLAKTMKNDADGLKKILIKTIASRHPSSPSEITKTQYESCRKFLSNFKNIYTFNYDLLLYWVLLHEPSAYEVLKNDGFCDPSNGNDNYVIWEPGNHGQNIYFLHGALHYFDSGDVIKKYTWKRTDIKLIDQIKEALDNHTYPLFVSEGSSTQKKDRIMHNIYLGRCYQSLPNLQGSLFIFGHSLSDQDNHILDIIPKNKVRYLFISTRVSDFDEIDPQIIRKTIFFVEKRKQINSKYPLHVFFYNADSAHIWT